MDAMGLALKAKMKKAPAPPPKEGSAKEEADETSDQEKAEIDLAPDIKDSAKSAAPKDADDEVSNLKSMGAGLPVGRKPMSLGERAKGKMGERMASIMIEK